LTNLIFNGMNKKEFTLLRINLEIIFWISKALKRWFSKIPFIFILLKFHKVFISLSLLVFAAALSHLPVKYTLISLCPLLEKRENKCAFSFLYNQLWSKLLFLYLSTTFLVLCCIAIFLCKTRLIILTY